MTIKYENQLKVDGVITNQSLKQKMLILKEESIFTGAEGTQHEIILWSRDKTGMENVDVIADTQDLLRSQFGDQIVFSGMNPDLTNPSEFEVWANQNKGYVVPLVTANFKGYLQLGSGLSKSSEFGDSKYLASYEGGKYDPNTLRVRTFEALSKEQQEAFKNASGPGVTTTSRAHNFQFEGVVKDIVFVTANKYEERENIKERTRNEIKQSILQSIQQIPEYQPIVAQLQQLPDDFAYSDLIDILGGTNCVNLTQLKDEMVIYGIKSLIENTARITLRGNIVNSETGVVFQSTATKLKKGQYGFGLQFEYLVGDFTPNDLSRLIATLSTLGISTQESINILTENNFYDPATNTLSYKTPQDALDVLRALLNMREVTLSSFIKEKTSKKAVDTNLMGAKMISFGPYVEQLPQYNGYLELDSHTVNQLNNIFTETQTTDTNPFEQTQTFKQEDLEVDQNPFAENMNTMAQNPVMTETQVTENVNIQNPFAEQNAQNPMNHQETQNPFGNQSQAMQNPFAQGNEQSPWA